MELKLKNIQQQITYKKVSEKGANDAEYTWQELRVHTNRASFSECLGAGVGGS